MPDRSATIRVGRLATLLSLCALATGCLGPEAIKRTRLRYNEAYRSTNDEQLLLNIVRLRYADSPVFVDLPTITGQFEASARGNYSGGIGGQIEGRTQLGIGELFFRDAPTLSYHPRDGQDMGKALMTPVTAELLRLMSPGDNTEQFLLMAVSDLNDVPNAPLATSLVPRAPDENARFRYGLDLLAALQRRGALEMGVATFDTDEFASLPTRQVGGEDVLDAVQAGYVFRTQGDRSTLKRRQKTVVLKVRPEAVRSFEMEELARTFELTPGLDTYKVRSELAEEDEADAPPSPLGGGGGDTILLNMRSTFQIMTFLAKGVCVPPEHVTEGIAPTTPGPGGRPFDWTRVTAGQFGVRSGKHRPRDSEVAVWYRGHWFWIERADVNSRAVLALLEILFALQESEREQLGPLLTLPIQ